MRRTIESAQEFIEECMLYGEMNIIFDESPEIENQKDFPEFDDSLSKENLNRLYNDEGLTMKEMADILEVNFHTLQDIMAKLRIHKKNRKSHKKDNSINVGDHVIWESQASGYWRRKSGIVSEISDRTYTVMADMTVPYDPEKKREIGKREYLKKPQKYKPYKSLCRKEK